MPGGNHAKAGLRPEGKYAGNDVPAAKPARIRTSRHGSGGRHESIRDLASNLQKVLTDLIELHVQGKQAHWNLVGTNFRDLHLQLDEIMASARLLADQTAERMRSLHALPDGRSATVSRRAPGWSSFLPG